MEIKVYRKFKEGDRVIVHCNHPDLWNDKEGTVLRVGYDRDYEFPVLVTRKIDRVSASCCYRDSELTLVKSKESV